MASGVYQRQCKYVVLNQIDKKPIRLNVALTETFEFSLQFVVMILFFQRFTLT